MRGSNYHHSGHPPYSPDLLLPRRGLHDGTPALGRFQRRACTCARLTSPATLSLSLPPCNLCHRATLTSIIARVYCLGRKRPAPAPSVVVAVVILLVTTTLRTPLSTMSCVTKNSILFELVMASWLLQHDDSAERTRRHRCRHFASEKDNVASQVPL